MSRGYVKPEHQTLVGLNDEIALLLAIWCPRRQRIAAIDSYFSVNEKPADAPYSG